MARSIRFSSNVQRVGGWRHTTLTAPSEADLTDVMGGMEFGTRLFVTAYGVRYPGQPPIYLTLIGSSWAEDVDESEMWANFDAFTELYEVTVHFKRPGVIRRAGRVH